MRPRPISKKDVYENICTSNPKILYFSDLFGGDDKTHKHRECSNKHKNKQLCDELKLSNLHDTCPETKVRHHFKVILGKYKATKDVDITHCVTADIKHHIKEIECDHIPCVKKKCKRKKSARDDKCRDIKIPECNKNIVYMKNREKCKKKRKN